MEPLVLRPRDQETAGSGDENVVANGIWNVWTVFIAGLQPRDKASTLVHKTIQFFFENLYEQRVSSHRKKTLLTNTVAVKSAARQGSDSVNYPLDQFSCWEWAWSAVIILSNASMWTPGAKWLAVFLTFSLIFLEPRRLPPTNRRDSSRHVCKVSPPRLFIILLFTVAFVLISAQL